ATEDLSEKWARLADLKDRAAAMERRFPGILASDPEDDGRKRSPTPREGDSTSARVSDDPTIAAFDEVIRRYGEATIPALQRQVGVALFNKALRLGQLGREAEEMDVYGTIVERFGDTADPTIQEAVAAALLNHAFRLGATDREEALEMYEQLVARF